LKTTAIPGHVTSRDLRASGLIPAGGERTRARRGRAKSLNELLRRINDQQSTTLDLLGVPHAAERLQYISDVSPSRSVQTDQIQGPDGVLEGSLTPFLR